MISLFHFLVKLIYFFSKERAFFELDYDYLYIAYSSIEFKESFFVHINDKENPLGLFKIINEENKITLVRID